MTLIQKKFNYEEIKRSSVSGKRMYMCPVTGTQLPKNPILDSTKDKTYLMEWRKKVGEETARMITKEASGIGTRMHKFLEDYINTGQWKDPGSNPYSQQAHKMAKVVHDQALVHVNEIWGTEVNPYHPKIYAGTQT